MRIEGTVSVVITCYKQSAFVGEAIESVLAQTRPACEIIVVDDGSPDDTAAIVAQYPSVLYIYQHNQDVSTARNTGLRQATGTYVVFLDGDDRLLPRALEIGLSYLEADSKYGFVAGKHCYISENGSSLASARKERQVLKNHFRELLHHNFIGCPATVIHRRDILNLIGGFNPAINPTGDWELYLRIAERFAIYCHTEVVAEYRLHSTNTSRSVGLMSEYSTKVLELQMERLKGNKQLEATCRKGIKFQQRVFRTEEMIARIRTEARARDWKGLIGDAMSLLIFNPVEFAKHAGRTMRKTFQGHREFVTNETPHT